MPLYFPPAATRERYGVTLMWKTARGVSYRVPIYFRRGFVFAWLKPLSYHKEWPPIYFCAVQMQKVGFQGTCEGKVINYEKWAKASSLQFVCAREKELVLKCECIIWLQLWESNISWQSFRVMLQPIKLKVLLISLHQYWTANANSCWYTTFPLKNKTLLCQILKKKLSDKNNKNWHIKSSVKKLFHSFVTKTLIWIMLPKTAVCQNAQ